MAIVLPVPWLAFASMLDHRSRGGGRHGIGWIMLAAWAVASAELATNTLPFFLAVLADVSAGTAHGLALANDLADDALFASIALFSVVAAPTDWTWLRRLGVLLPMATLVLVLLRLLGARASRAAWRARVPTGAARSPTVAFSSHSQSGDSQIVRRDDKVHAVSRSREHTCSSVLVPGHADFVDYVTKPFSPRELVARIRACLRRSDPECITGAAHALFSMCGESPADRTPRRPWNIERKGESSEAPCWGTGRSAM